MCSPLLDFGTAFLILLSYLILIPSGRALFALTTRDPGVNTRWTIADAWVLVLMFGVAGALCFRPEREIGLSDELIGLSMLYGMIFVGWYVGIRGLCENKVVDPLDRAMVLGVLLPPVFLWPLIWNLFNPILMALMLVPGLAFIVGATIWSRVVSKVLTRVMERRASPKTSEQHWIGGLRVVALTIAVTAASTTPLWAGHFASPFTFMPGLRAYRAEVLQTADIPAIQEWLGTLDPSDSKLEEKVWKGECPPCIRSLGRAHLTDRGTVMITRGGGFGHWGLEVAPKGTPTPAAMRRYDVLPVADGAWVFRENQ
jgi:hypothetical protein